MININQNIIIKEFQQKNRLLLSSSTSDNYIDVDFNSIRNFQLININQKILGDIYNLELSLTTDGFMIHQKILIYIILDLRCYI